MPAVSPSVGISGACSICCWSAQIGFHQLAADPQARLPGRLRDDDHERLWPRYPIEEQLLVSANLREARSSRRQNPKLSFRKATADFAPRLRRHHHALLILAPARGARRIAIVTIESDRVRNQKLHRRPFQHLEGQTHFVRVAQCVRPHFQPMLLEQIDPAAAIRRHLESRRHTELMPTDPDRVIALGLDEDAQAMGAEQPEIATLR